MASDHGVPQRDSFAKYTATFFANACSWRSDATFTSQPPHLLLGSLRTCRTGRGVARALLRSLSRNWSGRTSFSPHLRERDSHRAPLPHQPHRFCLELRTEFPPLPPSCRPFDFMRHLQPKLGRVRRPRNRVNHNLYGTIFPDSLPLNTASRYVCSVVRRDVSGQRPDSGPIEYRLPIRHSFADSVENAPLGHVRYGRVVRGGSRVDLEALCVMPKAKETTAYGAEVLTAVNPRVRRGGATLDWGGDSIMCYVYDDYATCDGGVACFPHGATAKRKRNSALLYYIDEMSCSNGCTINAGMGTFDCPDGGGGGAETCASVTISFSSSSMSPGGTITVWGNVSPAIPNQTVTFTDMRDGNISGGHSHNARPVGTFTAASGKTNSAGDYSTTYRATHFSGANRIRVSACGSEDYGEPVIQVNGLVELAPGNFNGIGNTGTHPWNHFGTPQANQKLHAIANAYAAEYPGSYLSFNDQSLEYGGILRRKWKLDITAFGASSRYQLRCAELRCADQSLAEGAADLRG